MCGIVGYTGSKSAVEVLLAGLSSLAYRGYDSAGVAVQQGAEIKRVRAAGKLIRLEEKLQGEAALCGHSGIGHTRWATHGAPTCENAHPHADATNGVMVVHNGIIENDRELRRSLAAQGVVFSSETDTEVIPHLLAHYMRERGDPIDAIRRTTARLCGAYALAVLFASRPGEVYAVRARSPLAVSVGEDGAYLASDVTALLAYSRRVAYPEEGEIVRLTATDITLYDAAGEGHAPCYETIAWEARAASLDGYRHFMEKELYEVPRAIEATLTAPPASSPPAALLAETQEVVFIGCGSAYHASLLGMVAGEEMLGMRVRAEIASEFRYRCMPLLPHTLAVAVSQSGETADTLAALQVAKERGCTTLAIVNVPSSAIARVADYVIPTHAGPEIAVATTKAYCAQVVAIWRLWHLFLLAKGRYDEAQTRMCEMMGLAASCREILASRHVLSALAAPLVGRHDIFFIGRAADAAVCREGALKLKEITYLHAEAFDAGELKHGTISLVEKGTPVVAVLTQPHVLSQTMSNVREVQARGAQVLALAADAGVSADKVFRLPPLPAWLRPLPAAYALQMIAYEVAMRAGVDVDMPRNLAKSVTVE